MDRSHLLFLVVLFYLITLLVGFADSKLVGKMSDFESCHLIAVKTVAFATFFLHECPFLFSILSKRKLQSGNRFVFTVCKHEICHFDNSRRSGQDLNQLSKYNKWFRLD